MTRQELIEKCYKELGLDPKEYPQKLEYLVDIAIADKKWSVADLMAQYIDGQEE